LLIVGCGIRRLGAHDARFVHQVQAILKCFLGTSETVPAAGQPGADHVEVSQAVRSAGEGLKSIQFDQFATSVNTAAVRMFVLPRRIKF
jgi:hypothetical protein